MEGEGVHGTITPVGVAFTGEEDQVKTKRGENAWAGCPLKDTAGTQQYRRWVAEEDGRKEDEKTSGDLNSIQEVIEHAARKVEAPVSTTNRDIVTEGPQRG